MKDINDENLPEANQILNHPMRVVFLAGTNQGKSHELCRIMIDEKYGMLDKFQLGNIYLFSPTASLDGSQNKLIEFLKYKTIQNKKKYEEEIDEDEKKYLKFDEENQIFEDSNQYTQRLIQLRDKQKALKKENKQKPMLIIFDDCQGELNMMSGIVPQLLVKQRHYDISSINLIQSLKDTINPSYRKQLSHLFVWGISNIDEIKALQREFAGTKQKQFLQAFEESSQNKYGYLMINKDLPIRYRFFNTIDQQYEL